MKWLEAEFVSNADLKILNLLKPEMSSNASQNLLAKLE